MIQVDHIKFDYIRRDEHDNVVAVENAIRNVSFTVAPGEFVAILGHNGSGKSTLAKHMNALLVPEEGTIWVDSIDTKDKEMIWDIRQRVGMVFQNPDNQIVANVVEEDVAFGPENLGIASPEIRRRLHEILDAMLADTVKARVLLPDGTYTKKPPAYEPVCAQVLLMKRAVEAAQQQSAAAPQEKRSLWEKLFHRKGR